MSLVIKHYFDSISHTVSYLVYCDKTSHAAIIDPVLDLCLDEGVLHPQNAHKIIDFVRAKKLKVEWILETHAHADHISAAHYLSHLLKAKIVIGRRITEVQGVFNGLFNLQKMNTAKPTDFDRLVKQGDQLSLGEYQIEVLETPGHTPACVSYKIDHSLFVGDSLFMPDCGTGRCDFPGGDASTLYDSLSHILSLPEMTVIYVCHDYMPNGREFKFQTTVAEEKKHNIHWKHNPTKMEFVKMREQRDATLAVPKLLTLAIQLNIKAGKLHQIEENGSHYLKIPIQLLEKFPADDLNESND